MTLEELEERLKMLEEIVQHLSRQPVEYNINVEKLIVKDPVLEQLTFKLEKIDIKDLSGSLNLGNNFGIKTKTHRKSKSKEYEVENVYDDVVFEEAPKERKPKKSNSNDNARKNKSEQNNGQTNPVNEDQKSVQE